MVADLCVGIVLAVVGLWWFNQMAKRGGEPVGPPAERGACLTALNAVSIVTCTISRCRWFESAKKRGHSKWTAPPGCGTMDLLSSECQKWEEIHGVSEFEAIRLAGSSYFG